MTVENTLYPVFLQLQGKKVLVVGGGNVAERKIRALLAAGADVYAGAPELTPALRACAQGGVLHWLAGRYDAGWLDDAWLVVAATDDRELNAQVSRQAAERRIWVNVVDDPELSAFQVPAVVDRAPITLAISSGGHAPVLARRLRERLESLVDHGMGRLAGLLAQRRAAIRNAYPDLAQRRRFYDWTLDGPVLALIGNGEIDAAGAMLDQALATPENWPRMLLTLLRAPAGDPGLLTLKGLRALHQADAIVFDPQHHAEAIVAMARRDAERLPVNLPGWLEQAAAIDEIARILQAHGRVVLLADAARPELEAVFSQLLAQAESRAIPVERL